MSDLNRLKLYQKDTGYRYNSDTMFLYDFTCKTKCKGNILDVGCGCGVLGLLLKRDFPTINLSQIDIQNQNVQITQKNAKLNSLESQVIEGDFLQTSFDKKFDLIVSNPPFYHDGVVKSESEHLAISRYNKYLPIDKFLEKCNKILTPHGRVVICYDAKQLPLLMSCFHKFKMQVERLRFIHTKRDKEASLVLIESKKSSKSFCKTMPPIFVHEESGFTKEAQGIFDKANTESLECKI